MSLVSLRTSFMTEVQLCGFCLVLLVLFELLMFRHLVEG